MISMSIYARRPEHGPRYKPGDIIRTGRKAKGTETRYGATVPVDLPEKMVGSVIEVSPFRYSEGYPPTWIYRVRFPEGVYWVRGGMIGLVERNPKVKKPVSKKQPRRRLRRGHQ